jgi:hypothetical protein
VSVVSEDVEELQPAERYLAVLCQVEGVLLGCGDVDDDHASLPPLEEGHHTRCLHCQPALLPKPELTQLAHTPGPHIAFVVHRHSVVIPCNVCGCVCGDLCREPNDNAHACGGLLTAADGHNPLRFEPAGDLRGQG